MAGLTACQTCLPHLDTGPRIQLGAEGLSRALSLHNVKDPIESVREKPNLRVYSISFGWSC